VIHGRKSGKNTVCGRLGRLLNTRSGNRAKKEEGRRKKEEGRRKKEEGKIIQIPSFFFSRSISDSRFALSQPTIAENCCFCWYASPRTAKMVVKSKIRGQKQWRKLAFTLSGIPNLRFFATGNT